MVALLAGLLAGCGLGGSSSLTERRDDAPDPAVAQAASSAVLAQQAEAKARVQCEARIAHLRALPALPGAPAYEARRAEIMGRAKGESVVFLSAPAEATDLAPRLVALRERLSKQSPIVAVPAVSEALKYTPEDARRVLLREGYVYAEAPLLATVLVDVLRLGRLFREPEIFLARGAEVHRLVRDNRWSVYRYAEGEAKGEEASLLHGDRVSVTREGLLPLLHRDLGKLARAWAPDRMRIERLTREGAVAELQYDGQQALAALSDDGQQLDVECLVPSGDTQRLLAARATNSERAALIEPVREAMRAMVQERIRFDEPLEEIGQQDGSLRPLWRWSYLHGGASYRFNEINYDVFDQSGRPHPPQVCIDFVLDAYERGSGTWYRGRGEPRERRVGAIDFDAAEGMRNRRSASEVVAFAQEHPEMFEVWTLPDEERIAFGRRGEFFSYLAEHAASFRVGDAVIIHGMKADGLAHWHSFIVDAIDPLTGVPYRLAGNAGRPRIQSWEGVMRSAPLRSIRYVLSPRLSWLQATMPRPAADSFAIR